MTGRRTSSPAGGVLVALLAAAVSACGAPSAPPPPSVHQPINDSPTPSAPPTASAEETAGGAGQLDIVDAPELLAGEGGVSGTIYWDRNSNGRQDDGEPGIPDVIVGKVGTPFSTATDSAGQFSLILPAGRHRLSVVTGWLRSQCPGDLVCAEGSGPQQSFAARNQFYRRDITLPERRRVIGLDAGFLPDHGDPTGAPGSANEGNDAGDGPAAVADLAVRHSIAGDQFKQCDDPQQTRVCEIGDTFATNVQIYNQGTTEADNIRFIVSEPAGTDLVSPPRPNKATTGSQAVPTGRTGTLSDGGAWVEYGLERPLPPAGAVFFALSWEVVAGPSSPRPYRTGTDRDKKSYLKISGADLAAADRDSSYGTDPTKDRNAGHNLNWPAQQDEDAMDTIEWNVG